MVHGEERVATDIDALLELVEERGRVTLREAARELNQPEAVIETWGNALREEGLVTIEYNIHGEMILVRTEKKKTETEEAYVDEDEVEQRVQQHLEEHEQLVRELKNKLGIKDDEVPREIIEEKIREIQELKEKIKQLERSIEELRRAARGDV